MGFELQLYSPNNNYDDELNPSYFNMFNMMFILAGLTMMIYLIAKALESNNTLNYESRFARILAGFFILTTRLWHSSNDDFKITNQEGKLLAIGPHRTGWEASIIASRMEGAPPQFLATDAHNNIPGVGSFLKMFKAILVPSQATKGENGRTAREDAIDLAGDVLNKQGCVALFPQGNMARIGQEAPRVYNGAAKIALKNNIPIHVYRLDGFWCLGKHIPLFISNNSYYRILASWIHPNKIHVTPCCEIDFHLKPENRELTEEAKIEEICAQLYAFFKHTKDLTPKQIDTIKTEISNKTHLLIWKNRVETDDALKKAQILKNDRIELEKDTSTAMSLSM